MGCSHPSHHPAKFMDLVPYESEDKIFLSRDHLIEVSRDFLRGVPLS